MIKLSKLKPNDSNPRIITEDKLEKLKKSISTFEKMMEIRPIVARSKDGLILAGNMRFRAISSLGYKSIPDEWVKYVDLTQEEENEFIIKDNIGFGSWDWDMLANEWDSPELNEWGLDVWVPENLDLDDFFEDQEDKENKSDKHSLTLHYSEDDYHKVITELNNRTGSKEKIIFDLLGL